MYKIVALVIFLIIILIAYLLASVFKKQIKFFISGLDAGFGLSDLFLLWKVSDICDLEQPQSLFFSMNSLKQCMTKLSDMTEADNTNVQLQKVLSKLFDFRTKLHNDSDSKKSLESTMFLDAGQKLRIILPGKGVFSSEILHCGKELIISVPKQHNLIPIPASEWVGKILNIYLWRSGDARYVFDTTVLSQGLFIGKSSITIKHSNSLVRTQKRKSIRAKCQIYGKLFIIKSAQVDYYSVETKNGYKCLIEDISESGALIRIGGKGVQNIKIKLQFNINNKLVIMFGDIKTIEYNETENQTLIHFECTHIDPMMKNEVLRYVYDVLPQSEKDILEAMNDVDEDEKNESPDENKPENSQASSSDSEAKNQTGTEQTQQVSEEETIKTTEEINISFNSDNNLKKNEEKENADSTTDSDVADESIKIFENN